LPGGEIDGALVTGAIDATAWAGPWHDTHMEFYEAAKYYYSPGFHDPGTMISLCMNKSWWEELSPSDKQIIEDAAAQEHTAMRAEFDAKNAEYLKELLNHHDVQLEHFDQKVYDAVAIASAEVMQEIITGNDLATRIYESYAKARSDTSMFTNNIDNFPISNWKMIGDLNYLNLRNKALGIGK
jgi:TRAP-type mannitol/chloroaromatic compound transport system substrate-binding protein